MDRRAELPAPRTEVVLGCEGHRGTITVINRRFLRWRCRQKRCRGHEGEETYHIADGLTGRLVRTEYVVAGRVIRSEEEPHGVR